MNQGKNRAFLYANWIIVISYGYPWIYVYSD
jgi:hypothetical protein